MWLAPRRTTRGGQPRYSDLAIETALTLGLVFGLRLRQVEGLLGSVPPLMGFALAVPDHTALSRRARTAPLLNQIDGRIGQFTADGAYDGKPTYDAATDHSAAAVIVVPPRANAIEPAGDQSPGQRDT
jgi:hypothetical protein